MSKQFLRTLTKFNTTTVQFLFITKGHKKQNPRSSCLFHPLGKEIHFSLCLILDTYLVKENEFKEDSGRAWGKVKPILWGKTDPGRSHMPRSNKACAPQLLSLCSGSHDGWARSAPATEAHTPQPALRNKRSHRNGKPTPATRGPTPRNDRKPTPQRRPSNS